MRKRNRRRLYRRASDSFVEGQEDGLADRPARRLFHLAERRVLSGRRVLGRRCDNPLGWYVLDLSGGKIRGYGGASRAT